MTKEERDNKFECLMMLFGSRMAQQRGLKETIVSERNPYIIERAREKLKECEREAGNFRDEIYELLTTVPVGSK